MEAQRVGDLDEENALRVAAGRVQHAGLEELLLLGLMSAKLEPGATDNGDLVSLRRPRGIDVMPHRRREPDGLRTRCPHRFPHVAAGRVAPRDVRDPLSVGRKRGRVLPFRERGVVFRQAPRCAGGLAALGGSEVAWEHVRDATTARRPGTGGALRRDVRAVVEFSLPCRVVDGLASPSRRRLHPRCSGRRKTSA